MQLNDNLLVLMSFKLMYRKFNSDGCSKLIGESYRKINRQDLQILNDKLRFDNLQVVAENQAITIAYRLAVSNSIFLLGTVQEN